jgi:hypothetical protein
MVPLLRGSLLFVFGLAELAKMRLTPAFHRPDCVQIVIALVVTPEGLPLLAHGIVKRTGNLVDCSRCKCPDSSSSPTASRQAGT